MYPQNDGWRDFVEGENWSLGLNFNYPVIAASLDIPFDHQWSFEIFQFFWVFPFWGCSDTYNFWTTGPILIIKRLLERFRVQLFDL